MIEEALKLYPFKNPQIVEIRHNENWCFKVTDEDKKYLLRIHEANDSFDLDLLKYQLSNISLIDSELEILRKIGGLQSPVLSIQKRKVNLVNNTPVSLLTWIDGEALSDNDKSRRMAYLAGKMCGNLYKSLSVLTGYTRINYDEALIKRMITELDSWYSKDMFNSKNYQVMRKKLISIGDILRKNRNKFVLCHGDLGLSNIIYDGTQLKPIDFSLSGYCLKEFDIASSVCAFGFEYESDILFGYKSETNIEVDEEVYHLMVSFQILLFIICQHKRFDQEEWFKELIEEKCNKEFK